MFNLKIFQNSAFEDAFSILIFTIVNIVFLVLFFLVIIECKKSYKGLKEYFLGSVIQIASIIVLTFVYPIKVEWLKLTITFLANMTLLFSFIIIVKAFLSLMNKELNKLLAAIIFIAGLVISITLINHQEAVFSLAILITLFFTNIFIIIKGDILRRKKEEQVRWLPYIVINISALFLILTYAFYLVVLKDNSLEEILLHNGEMFVLRSVLIMGSANVIALSMTFNCLIVPYEKVEKDVFIELFENAPFIVLAVNSKDLLIKYVNPVFINETGYKKSETLQKMTVKDLKFSEEVNKKILNSLLKKEKLNNIEVKLVTKKGEKIYGSLSTAILENEIGFHLIINIVNVSNLFVSKESYKTLSLIDYLTSLPNRRALISNMEKKIKDEKHFTIIMIDLDNFKMINDKYGHSCGDMVLKKVGEKLRFINVDPNIVSRYGGDEFVILLSKDKAESEIIIKQIKDIFEKPFNVKSRVVDIKASIGYAYFPEHGKKIDTLLRKADSYLYKDKNNSLNNSSRINRELKE